MNIYELIKIWFSEDQRNFPEKPKPTIESAVHKVYRELGNLLLKVSR